MELRELVLDLPEVYQNIYGHPEFSNFAKRPCLDRLHPISSACSALANHLCRQIRILDLGCAQGYFSLKLAESGAIVHGIDFNHENIEVCKALACEYDALDVSFSVASAQDMIHSLKPGEYDVVLGLSIFHHLIHEQGMPYVQELIDKIASTAKAMLLELALCDEPLYWANSQPSNPRTLIDSIAFSSEILKLDTHLGDIKRPLFFASNLFTYLGGKLKPFQTWTAVSNPKAPATHENSRRFYWGEHMSKHYLFCPKHTSQARVQVNLSEYLNEIIVLTEYGPDLGFPALVDYGRSDTEGWIVRENIEGASLEEVISRADANFDPETISLAILEQLVSLERLGLCHSDIRSWNIVITPAGRAFLVDHGSILQGNRDCMAPFNSCYSFALLLLSIFKGVGSAVEPIGQAFNLSYLPSKFRRAALDMLCHPQSDSPFSAFDRIVKSASGAESPFEVSASPSSLESILELLRSEASGCGLRCNSYKGRIEELEHAQAASTESFSAIEKSLAVMSEKLVEAVNLRDFEINRALDLQSDLSIKDAHLDSVREALLRLREIASIEMPALTQPILSS